jgi:hypothetical protein
MGGGARGGVAAGAVLTESSFLEMVLGGDEDLWDT